MKKLYFRTNIVLALFSVVMWGVETKGISRKVNCSYREPFYLLVVEGTSKDEEKFREMFYVERSAVKDISKCDWFDGKNISEVVYVSNDAKKRGQVFKDIDLSTLEDHDLDAMDKDIPQYFQRDPKKSSLLCAVKKWLDLNVFILVNGINIPFIVNNDGTIERKTVPVIKGVSDEEAQKRISDPVTITAYLDNRDKLVWKRQLKGLNKPEGKRGERFDASSDDSIGNPLNGYLLVFGGGLLFVGGFFVIYQRREVPEGKKEGLGTRL